MPDDCLARALGSKVRRDMLRVLHSGPSSVHKLAELLRISEVNASKHLKKLYDLGLLTTATKGRERFYELKVPELKQLIEQYDLVVRKIMGSNNHE